MWETELGLDKCTIVDDEKVKTPQTRALRSSTEIPSLDIFRL